NALEILGTLPQPDLVVTNFFLDCLSHNDAAKLIDQLSHRVAPGAQWVISEFHIPENGWRRVHAGLWIWVMYRFFRLAPVLRISKIPPYREILRTAGWRMLKHEMHRFDLISSELWTKSV